MRIAVVGATGMLGHHVAREARRSGHDVIALYRSPNLLEPLQYLDCEPRQADLEDVNSLLRSFSGVDAVIHCAAYYPGNPKPLDVEMQTATRLTENFYAACASVPLKKIVYCHFPH
jgi:dihydroflavonol-4-reductase